MLKPIKLKEEERSVLERIFEEEEHLVLERIIEYPFIIKNVLKLEKKGRRILDAGCAGSYLITVSAALGHEVHGIDTRRWPVKYLNVNFVQGDVRMIPYPDNFFDVVVAVSTIEHVGIRGIKGTYGLDQEDPEGDKKAIQEMARVLKKDGKILITIPYGKGDSSAYFRVYNCQLLKELIPELTVDTAEYYAIKRNIWTPISEAEAENVISDADANAVVLLALSKK